MRADPVRSRNSHQKTQTDGRNAQRAVRSHSRIGLSEPKRELLTMSGLAGRLFAPLGVAYIFAILASLLVALTVTPALCVALLGRRNVQEQAPIVVRWLQERYRALLLQVERSPRAVVGGVALCTVAGLATLPLFGGQFLPELSEGHFIVHMSAVPGTSLQESLRLGHQVTFALLKIPYVRSVAQRVGRAE